MNPPTDRERPALSAREAALSARTHAVAVLDDLRIILLRAGTTSVSLPRPDVIANALTELLVLPAPAASPKPALTQGGVAELVQIEPERLLELLRGAYLDGCHAVHENYQPDPYPEFGEAADDYVARLDLTEDTRPVRQESAATALERLAGERGGEADYYPSHEALSDLVHLLAEEDFLGRNHGWKERWDRALSVATDLVRVEP